MSTPQVEGGFTRIADELYDAILRFDFSKRELKVILAVIHRTYGFNKKVDFLAHGQIANMVGLDRANVSKTVNTLTKNNVLFETGNKFTRTGSPIKEIGLNKKYEEWQHVVKTTKCVKTVKQAGQTYDSNAVTVTHTIDKPIDKTIDSTPKRFNPPTVDDVKQYCLDCNQRIDAERFIDYYASIGWVVGKDKKMKDWKAAVRNWVRRDQKQQQGDAPTLKVGDYL